MKVAVVFAISGLWMAAGTASTDPFSSYSTPFADKPIEAVRTAAEAGDGMAQLKLGHRYYEDKSLKDDKAALS